MLVVRLALHKSLQSCIATWVLTFYSRQLFVPAAQGKTQSPSCNLGKGVWRLQSGSTGHAVAGAQHSSPILVYPGMSLPPHRSFRKFWPPCWALISYQSHTTTTRLALESNIKQIELYLLQCYVDNTSNIIKKYRWGHLHLSTGLAHSDSFKWD